MVKPSIFNKEALLIWNSEDVGALERQTTLTLLLWASSTQLCNVGRIVVAADSFSTCLPYHVNTICQETALWF